MRAHACVCMSVRVCVYACASLEAEASEASVEASVEVSAEASVEARVRFVEASIASLKPSLASASMQG